MALETEPTAGVAWTPGTYELIGPKINGNPEGEPSHRLIKHAFAEQCTVPVRTYEAIRAAVWGLAEKGGCEGIVFHHPDGRMAKIEARDFPPEPPRFSITSAEQ